MKLTASKVCVRRQPSDAVFLFAAGIILLAGLATLRASAQSLPMVGGDAGTATGERFSFVVHGDLTGGERPGIFALAARQIALLQPDFVISVGDLIEGDGQSAAALHHEWDAYEHRAETTQSPVYLVGGNHDLTSALQRDIWHERYGPTYYHFRYRDVLFLVLDTEDYTPERRAQIAAARDEANAVAASRGWDAFGETAYAKMPERSTGAIGPDQRDYFLKVLTDNVDVRWTFLFMHKAPWESDDSDGFARLEAALASRPYTLFHGHEHAQARVLRQGREYIRLATTGGVQFPDKGRSVDQVALVTVSERISVATLDLAGIRTSAGALPQPAAKEASSDSASQTAPLCAAQLAGAMPAPECIR